MSVHKRRAEQVLCSAVVENIHGCSEFRDIFRDTNWEPSRSQQGSQLHPDWTTPVAPQHQDGPAYV